MAEARLSRPLALRPAGQLFIGRENLPNLLEATLEPVVLSIVSLGVGLAAEGTLSPSYLLLAILAFSLSFPGTPRLHEPLFRSLRKILATWALLAGLLLLLGYATRSFHLFGREALAAWLLASPACLLAAHLVLRWGLPRIVEAQGAPKRVVIVGMNTQGLLLARNIASLPYGGLRLMGFFDDRDPARLEGGSGFPLLGRSAQLADYVRENRIHGIYLSLPMATQPRILQILDDLKDTTASIHFVPDMLVTDLIQGRMESVGDVPVVAVCETPFRGVNGLLKRGSDILLSLVILLLISPLLGGLALAVKLTSPGPVIFRQRRYGLDGEEIVVYKFRSMTVCEDGAAIVQAQKNDSRITPLGAFMRKTSLDELPQFINVLQGRMSIVGPRPHAVAHNELYRKLIKGYMVRHKVKPGITGWAQVNGYRGETETVDKMQARIDYDLDYLRHWSMRLDLLIVLRTVGIVFKDSQAY